MTSGFLSTTDSRAFSMREEQTHLLESIAEETNPLALRNLKERYNQVVDRQLEQHRGPLPDPIEYFPPEIWLQIFGGVGSGHPEDDESNPIDHLLLASLVSRKWRDAILNTPEIWTEVTVDPVSTSWEDELFKLQMAMHLSGGGLLTLILRPSSYRQWEGKSGVHRIISNHARRIRKIVFESAGNNTFRHYAVNPILLSLGPLPQLRVIRTVKGLVGSSLSWDDFLSNAPGLVSLNIVSPVDVLRGDHIKSCRDISVSRRLCDISTYLVKFQSLKSLSCWGDIHLPTYPPSQLCLDPFRGLEEFNYYQLDIQPVLSILQVTVKLTTLLINVGPGWFMLTVLLQACHLLRSLFSLDIRLVDPANPNEITLSGPAGPLMVRSLVIKYSPTVALLGQRSIVPECHIADLVDVLQVCTPAVEEFHFHAEVMNYVPFKYVSSRKRLFRLTLSLPELTSIPDDMLIQPKSLGCLNLKINATLIPSFFRGFECPNLHRIVFLANDKFGPSFSTRMARCDPAALPQLESIEWRNYLVLWQITSLQALRKIILTKRSREKFLELCLHLIMRPYDCPSLDYIELGAIPEWDLLFMMLERRNHSTRHGVSRITTLAFPTGIPYSILAPITELLNGRFAIGLSYHDVSISSIAEFYFDISITGCKSCLVSMHSCTRSVKTHAGGFTYESNRPEYLTPPAANPPLSDEMSSWLDGREERRRNWNAKDAEWRQQCAVRSNSCGDPILSKRMVVKEWSLKGVHLDTTIANRDN